MGDTNGPETDNGLSRGKLLARNTLLNVLGTVALLVTAAAATPLLIEELGISRFGLLALAWALIGTFGVLDLGLGRALTREVARHLGRGGAPIDSLASTFLALFVALGVSAALLLALFSGVLVEDVLEVRATLTEEAILACQLLAVALPVVVVTTGLRGVLEAHQRFDLVNALRVPIGVLTVAGPLLVLPVSHNIGAIVGALVAVRILGLVAHAASCWLATDLRPTPPQRRLVKPAVKSAGWLTVASLIRPLLMYPDRFIVGATVSAAAVALYAAPHDLATRLLLIPAAPIPVLFPAFAATYATERNRFAVIFTRSVRYMAVLVVPLMLFTVTFAEEGMRLWLGPEFAGDSARVLQLLAIGALCQALAQIPFVLLQGAGRADLTAKLLLAELLPYLLALWLAIRSGGILGAATVWLARALIDSAVLYLLAARLLGLPWTQVRRATAAFAGFLLVNAGLVALALDAVGKGIMLAACLAVFGVIAWTLILSEDERRLVMSPLHARRT
jgi:O-antigen/teichoic acid export membrane protein